METKRLLTRRQFLGTAAVTVLGAGVAQAFLWAPHRLRVSHLKLADNPVARFVLWSDFHYRGDQDYAEEVVATINRLNPDFVCFLGDLIDDSLYQTGALRFVRKIQHPVYGVPGNHDYGCRAPFGPYFKAFADTGGAWLVNKTASPPGGAIELCGSAERYVGFIRPQGERPRVLLTHYPMTANETAGRRFAAVFAGHSHGGQVRIPFYGAVALPRHVGHYDMGLFSTPAGPLYVNVGVGTYGVPARMNCPPEITVVEL
ncbi:MAG: metallophosphoesterase [Verrucomicrobia bacterium]|nr:metallophosphoesterase [Verrucomicrobiota bacterium]